MAREGYGRSTTPSPARFGLVEPKAASLLEALGWSTSEHLTILRAIGKTPDPDQALATLARILVDQQDSDHARDFSQAFYSDENFQRKFLAVAGTSSKLADHMVVVEHSWKWLRRELPTGAEIFHTMLSSVDASLAPIALPDQPQQFYGSEDLATPGVYRAAVKDPVHVSRLQNAYRNLLLSVSGCDLATICDPDSDELDLAAVTGFLTDLADAAITAALAVANRNVFDDEPTDVRLAVIAMGKCGARELNYISDVDVIFAAEPANSSSTKWAAEMMSIGSAAFFEVDAALRPEGKRGELVRTLASHEAYYQRWAKTWEFQALLKARPMTGDMDLAQDYFNVVNPLVWTASEREEFVPDVQAMRRRVEDNVPSALRERELKLGTGGLRDVEFAVQLLQLVHGRDDPALRTQNTLLSLQALEDRGYIARSDGDALQEDYAFLRKLEHRLQLQRLKRTHLLPPTNDDEAYRWLALASNMSGSIDALPQENLRKALRVTSSRVRQLHEKLFYRPLLDAIVASDADSSSMASVQRQLAALGFAHPQNCVNHVLALVGERQRKGRIQQLLLPALLEWLADTPDPDAGLLAYRRLSEECESREWFLRLLRDDSIITQRLMTVLGTSPYVAALLLKNPEVLHSFSDGSSGPKLIENYAGNIRTAMQAATVRQKTPKDAVVVARSLRRAELCRIASADILGLTKIDDLTVALSNVWTTVLQAALQRTIDDMLAAADLRQQPAAIAVIGMGRLGGSELGYGSDADVMFVCSPAADIEETDAITWATTVINRVMHILAVPSSDPPLAIDADLRPQGKRGPLVRTLKSYAAYYEQWAETWEYQALLRAQPVAGDQQLGQDFVDLIDRYRYPSGGIGEASIREIRRIKARVDNERLPKRIDPRLHTKLGPGGLGDIEWTVQLLTMQYCDEVPAARTPSTLKALAAFAEAEIIDHEQADILADAWKLATSARNAIVLTKGKASDVLPPPGAQLNAVAVASGFHFGDSSEFMDHYLKTTRQARKVVDTLFWGNDS